ncbi:glycosyltransferase [Hymenobacter taeanensis]|uniref:Glycosyltransferase n=1 Tax=Hymenobacter taeanensis TaxID=2735321 RepID=A0A6M6BCL3_9BACT|nr:MULTISPECIES: glycosyltransferase family 4 protein [Hymenobacter]QJX45660.1 glycosyltransferase [Hymenobacter taeanensis]UOQ79497.1 glycosyltransferase family 4 protein [Hymenobacter sp. 5414T-23]
MTPAASHVLLLGWDDSPRSGEQSAPPVLTLVQALAPHTPLAIVLPRRSITLTAAPNANITVLSELTPEQVKAFPARPDHAAGWQVPTAPYLGSSAGAAGTAGGQAPLATPVEPYIGRSAQSASISTAPSTTEGTQPTAPAGIAALQTPQSLPQPVIPTGGLLNHDEFEDDGAEPDATEAQDLSQPQDDLVPNVAAAENSAPAAPTNGLPDSLAALQLTPTAEADLNYQVIQYARLASRQVAAEDVTVIYASDWPTWLAAMEIRQQTGRPLVLHVHSLAQDRNTPADRGWILELERIAMRRADVVLAASEAVAERVRAAYPAAAQNLQVVSSDDTAALQRVLGQLESGWARR